MNIANAIWTLRKHNAEFKDEKDSFLRLLRPYVGIKNQHFCEIIKALYFAAPELNSVRANRDLTFTIWSMTRNARYWTAGKREPMFHGKDFIGQEDKTILDRWIALIESITLDLLRGQTNWRALERIAEEVNLHDTISEADWLTIPFTKLLKYHYQMESHGGFSDDEEILCRALKRIGTPNSETFDLLELIGSDSKFESVRIAALDTAHSLRGG